MTQALVLPHEDRPPSLIFNFGLPLAVLGCFGGLAVALRPDILSSISSASAFSSGEFASVWNAVKNIELVHVGVWLAVMWITAGLLRPVMNLAVESPARIDPDEVGYYRIRPPLKPLLLSEIGNFAVSDAEEHAVK